MKRTLAIIGIVVFLFVLLAVRGVMKELGPEGIREVASVARNDRPQTQTIDNSRWFEGDTTVPGNVSEASPLYQPCPSPRTPQFEEAFRARRCSIIVYAEQEDRFLFWGWEYPVRQRLVSQNVFSAVDDIHSNHGDRYFMTRNNSFPPPLSNATSHSTAAAQQALPVANRCERTAFTSADFRGDGKIYMVDAFKCGNGNKVVISGSGLDGRDVRCELTHYGRWSIDGVKVMDKKDGSADTLEITSSYGSNRSIEFVHWSMGMLKVYDFEQPGDLPVSCQQR